MKHNTPSRINRSSINIVNLSVAVSQNQFLMNLNQIVRETLSYHKINLHTHNCQLWDDICCCYGEIVTPFQRPRFADVDVVAAGDAESPVTSAISNSPEVLTSSTGTINGHSSSEADTIIMPSGETIKDNIDSNMCHVCSLKDDPPPGKRVACKSFRWIECERCPRLYHSVCVGIRGHVDSFVCDMCFVRL